MEINQEEIKKILKDKKAEMGIEENPKSLFQFLFKAYKKWNFERKTNCELKRAQKQSQRKIRDSKKSSNISYNERIDKLIQIQKEIWDPKKSSNNSCNEGINKSMQNEPTFISNSILELPFERISEKCKQQIRELILADINEQIEKNLGSMNKEAPKSETASSL